jgi:hypothetical protein
MVIADGLLWVAGVAVLAFAGEKVAEIAGREKDSECCCGARGPSGKPKQHFILKNSRKEALEAALHYGPADSVIPHSGYAQGVLPHFHPAKGGVKIVGAPHFEYTN